MKNRIIQVAAALALVLLGTTAVGAQTTSAHTLLRANIPFAFVAGGVVLPAGQYRVYHPGNPYVIVVENDDGTARAMTYVRPSAINSAQTSTKLLFNKYGDQYFLAKSGQNATRRYISVSSAGWSRVYWRSLGNRLRWSLQLRIKDVFGWGGRPFSSAGAIVNVSAHPIAQDRMPTQTRLLQGHQGETFRNRSRKNWCAEPLTW
jgi:hypothetical protein